MSEIQNLRTLIVVAEVGSFHRASKILNISQPAVSKRIRVLEASFDCKLIDHSQHRCCLTDNGRTVVNEGAGIIESYTRLRRLTSQGEKAFQRLELGVIESVIMSWFPRFMIELRKVYGNIDINMDCSPTADLEKRLISREIDMAFMLGPSNDGRIVSIPTNSVRCCFVGPKNVEITSDITELSKSGLSLITLPRGSRPHTDLLFALKEKNIHQQFKYISTNSVGTLLNLVRLGLGVGVIPHDLITNKDLKEIDFGIPVPELRYAGCYLKSRINPIYSDLCQLAVRVARSHQRYDS